MTIFNEIKKILPIEFVVEKHTKLTRDGSYLKGHCVLCDCYAEDKTSEFVINVDKQIFYCFSCKKGGDLITFASSYYECSPIDASATLIGKYLKFELKDDIS